MKRNLRGFAAAGSLFLAMFVAEAAFAQKQGGILKMYDPDSPASMSIHEEATIVSERPMMGVFNNLVMFDQHVKQNSLESIVPDLATGWSWNEDGTELTLPLRQGVTWHDGKPFTAKDVQCTWDLLTGKASEKLRVNPRKSWYRNLSVLSLKWSSKSDIRMISWACRLGGIGDGASTDRTGSGRGCRTEPPRSRDDSAGAGSAAS